MKVAFEQIYNGSLSVVSGSGNYTSSKIYVTGSNTNQLGQYNLGVAETDKYLGPMPTIILRPTETALARSIQFTHPIQIHSNEYWILGADNNTAAASRIFQMYKFTPSTNAATFLGGISVTGPGIATAATVRGTRILYRTITSGYIVTGSAVSLTGSNTAFITDRVCVGSRIGFGSTSSADIQTWYEVSSTPSETTLILSESLASDITSSTQYIIEDFMLVQVTSNATTTNGGLFVTKGLRPELFTATATIIPTASNVDNIRATYWLKDASTVTNTVAGGSALGNYISPTSQSIYVCDGATTSLRMYVYNVRAPLTGLVSGVQILTPNVDIITTGIQTVTGNILRVNNGRIGILNHGPGSGSSDLYLATTSRLYRIPTTGLLSGSTTIVADSMIEVPPNGVSSNQAGGFEGFDISDTINKLILWTPSTFSTGYLTNYTTDSSQFDRRFAMKLPQLDAAVSSTDQFPHPHYINSSTPINIFIWAEGGYIFWNNISTVNGVNVVYIYPLAADYMYGSRIILPAITLGSAYSKLYKVLVNSAQYLGNTLYGMSTEGYILSYRTAGIDDDTGAWTAVPQTGNLNGVSVPDSIQFSFQFRTMGHLLIPAKILSLSLLAETNDALSSQYRWNLGDTDTTNGTFAWIQGSLFNASIPTHTISVYRADTNALVFTQASTGTTNGTFEYFSGTWISGLGADVINTRRRFVPTVTLPSGIDLYATITVA